MGAGCQPIQDHAAAERRLSVGAKGHREKIEAAQEVEEEEAEMKIDEFAEIIASMAKNHPEAEVVFSYPARHAGRPTTKRGGITGYRASVSDNPVVKPTVWIEIDYSRSTSVKDADSE